MYVDFVIPDFSSTAAMISPSLISLEGLTVNLELSIVHGSHWNSRKKSLTCREVLSGSMPAQFPQAKGFAGWQDATG